MKIFRSVLSGLAAFICLSSIVGLVYLFTLQATVLDRTVVKGWLSESKIYEGNLLASLIQPAETLEPLNASAVNATPEAIKAALGATFTPEYMQQQAEVVIDSAYDWTEGKKSELTFSLPVNQKRDTFTQQLAKALEPQISALPVCGTTQATTCRPANLSVEQLAIQMTTQSIEESGAFATPITPAMFPVDPRQPNASTLTQLPAIRKIIDLLFIILPIMIILSAAATVFTIQIDQRSTTAIRLSRRVFFSMLLTAITALIVVFVLSNNYYDLSKIFAAQVGDFIVPLIKIIIIDIAINLAVFSGIAGVIAAASWITLHHLRRKNATLQASNTPMTSYRY